KAGIARIEMDLSDFHIEEIPPIEVVPAPAQGVLAVQIRETDQELYELLQKIHDRKVADVIGVERRVLNLFDAGCHAPLGCFCRETEDGQYESWTSIAEEMKISQTVFIYVQSVPKGWPSIFLRNFKKNENYLRVSSLRVTSTRIRI